jgi:cobalt/nickel transport system ATP-binding protein
MALPIASNQQTDLAFEVQDLSFSYNNQIPALEHVDLSVRRGEKLVILGSNGSGKSTLLKILDGLYYPTSGTVRVFGQVLSEQALRDDRFNHDFRSRVGFVFQDSDVQLFMPNVWDEIAFGPLQLGLPADEVTRRVEAALDALKIAKLRERAPHQLSGGEKKRVALASVLTLMPDVWLLDEPTAGLDPRSISWLIDFINAQGQAGKTVVLATHDLGFVEAVADRVYVFDETHRVVAAGTPPEIMANEPLLIQANLMREK